MASDAGPDVLQGVNSALDDIDRMSSVMIEDLARMVAIDTSFPPGRGYDEFADLIEGLVAPLGFACERIVVPEHLWRTPEACGPRTNILARRRSGRAVLPIYFHMDTVPAGEGWTVPPLTLTRDGDRLLGRGTADMKGAIAAVLAAIRAADRNCQRLVFDPMLVLCTDEEGGLYPGVRYLAEQRKLAEPVLCMNGGAVPRIYAGSFGSMDFHIRFVGRSAHSGDPRNGVNALEEAVPVMAVLVGLQAKIAGRRSAMPSPPHFEGAPLHARLSLTAGHAGFKGSALPGSFDLTVNRRYAPEEDAADVEAEIRDTVRQAVLQTRLLGCEIALTGHLAPVSDPQGPHGRRWQHALAQGFGWSIDDFQAYGSSTSSDMGWVQQAGIREILLGGLSRPDRNVHAADEYTTLTDMRALAKAVLLFLSQDFEPGLIARQ